MVLETIILISIWADIFLNLWILSQYYAKKRKKDYSKIADDIERSVKNAGDED